MKIIKYKKGSNGKYKVFLDDGRELSLYEETILKYELLLKKEVNDSDLFDINNYNLQYDVYYIALRSFKSRFRSENDLRNILIKKEYPIDLIEKAIDKLKSQGYLNDELYCKSYINNQIITSSKGPNKIKMELLNSGISSDIIENNINIFEKDSQVAKIKKITEKMLKSNRNKGGSVLRKKISTYLCNLGYNNGLVYEVLSDYDFSNSKEDYEKEYNKLYVKYSRKYSGIDLENKIKEKLYYKGLIDDNE